MQSARLRSGIELHYEQRGTGTPLILIHGGTGDLLSWRPQVRRFSRCYRVIAYSRRYHYPNANDAVVPDYSAQVDACDLEDFLNYLRLGKVSLVGTSYGAFAGLLLALKDPKRVRSLVLAEPPVHRLVPLRVYREFLKNVWHPAAEAFSNGRARNALQTLADGMWGTPVFAQLSRDIVRGMLRNARAMNALVLSRDPFPRVHRQRLRRLRLPVLLITGQHAAAIHRRVNHELTRLLPNVSEATIPGASHGSPRENPRAFNRAVLEFLRNT